MLFSQRANDKSVVAAKEEFKRLWNNELLKDVDSRDFSKAYNYAMRKHSIKEWAIKLYFDFESENSIRYKEACDAFDDGDILWTFMFIREFSSLPGHNTFTKHLTNKRRAFLSDKRKESVISRNSVRGYMHDLVTNHTKAGEEFIKAAVEDMQLYDSLKEEGRYKSAYKIAALTDKTGEYTSNIKKYLYYAAKRPITEDNHEQTLRYFDYVGRYYNFKRKLYGGGYITVKDIDVLIATIAFMRNGGKIDQEKLLSDLHRTVKVYCKENIFAPVCILADYLYQIGEIEMEQKLLKLLVHYGEAIDEKYRKRSTCLELLSKNSNNFIFRHNMRTPLECILYEKSGSDIDSFREMITKNLKEKTPNSWCIALKREIRTYVLNYKFYFDEKLFSSLETVLDNEFGDFVLEYGIHSYFSGDKSNMGNRSMLIVTSGKNKYTDFPKLGILVNMEPITKKNINVQYCVLYLPEESYTDEMLDEDSRTFSDIINGNTDSRFNTFISVIETLIWDTVDRLLNK